MVRERKTRLKDIEKLHELIDSASLPKQRTLSPQETEKLNELRKKLSEDTNRPSAQASTPKHPQSEGLQPRVALRKQQEPQKKEERVIQIDLGPRPTQKTQAPPPVNFLPVKEEPFAKEPLFDIEKITPSKKKPAKTTQETRRKKQPKQKEFIPIKTSRSQEENLP